MHYFSIFYKEFNKEYISFSRFWRKSKLFAKFWEILEIFDENAIENWIFIYFGKVVAKNLGVGVFEPP